MFRRMPSGRKRDEMAKGSVIVTALLGPVAGLATCVLVAWVLVTADAGRVICGVVVLVWIGALVLRRLLRRRQLLPLLEQPPRAMRRLVISDFGVRAESRVTSTNEDVVGRSLSNHLASIMGARRIVLLSGNRLSGRTRTAFEVLHREFGPYVVLCPARVADAGKPPLTTLLTSGLLSLRRRYILWLDDVGPLLDAGFDPRIVERWLAAGIGRVAVGTITPAELARIRAAGTSAALALERAAHIAIEAPPILSRPSDVLERYRRAAEMDARADVLIRIIATCELLGLSTPSDEFLGQMFERLTGQRLNPQMVEQLCSGPSAPLRRSDQALSAHPELTAVIDEELKSDADVPLISALIEMLDPPALLVIGQALATRQRLEDADIALRRARILGPEDLQPAVTRAIVGLLDIKEGPSGASLSNAGGLDFAERMGPSQRESTKRLLPRESDGVFEPALPPETDGWSARFYRLTVYRAFARVGILIAIDTIAIAVASAAALAVRAAAQDHAVHLFDEDFLQLLLSAALVTVVIAVWLGLYTADAERARPHLILATMTIMSTTVAAGFLIARVDIGSLSALLAFFAVAVAVDCGLRYLYDHVSRNWVHANHLQSRVMLLGRPDEARSFAQNIRSANGRPVQNVAFLSPQQSDDPFCVGVYDDLEGLLHDLHIAEVIIVDRSLTTSEKARYIGQAQSLGVDVRFAANDSEIILGAVGRVGDFGLVHVPAALMTPESLELKRIIDYVLVTITLPLWLGIIGLYAVYSLGRRSGQPTLVTADRVGLGGIGFSMLRLRTRTMHPDGTRGTKPTGRIEALLEQTGLDELPQVINVLRGEMSLVGPRPLGAQDVAGLTLEQRRTLAARPGMTGRWQVAWPYGASEADMRAMDADYLRQWRISHDMDLLLRTPIAIARRRIYLGDTEIHRRRGAPSLGW